MKKILLIFICFALISPVFAANWKEIGNKLYLDTNSIEQYSESYTLENTEKYSFWTKSLNDGSLHFTELEKILGKKVWYILSRDIIDCDKKAIANKSIAVYDLKAQFIDSIENQIHPFSWKSIIPDSMGEMYYSRFCKVEKVEEIKQSNKPEKPVSLKEEIKDNAGSAINWGPYMRELERRIKRNWNPPKGDASKRAVVSFKIGRDGRLLSIRMLKSSGSVSNDEAAKAAIEMTSPFKPLPAEFKGSSIDIEFTFDYNVLGAAYR